MRIGLTITDSTTPSVNQVNELLREGVHRVSDLLGPKDLWPLTNTIQMEYSGKGIAMTDLADNQENIEGFAEIVSVYRQDDGGSKFIRCTEINSRDFHKASNNQESMVYGTSDSPVFTYRDGKLVILPKPKTGKTAEVNYLGSITVDSETKSIPGISPHVETVILNYATAQAADMLAAYYAQDDDPVADKIAILAKTQMQFFMEGVKTLEVNQKLRGHIS